MEVASTIKSQLTNGRDVIKVMSWGARDWTAVGNLVDTISGIHLGALRFRVSGAKFKGIIEIALMPSDTYTVTLFKMDKRQPKGVKIVEVMDDIYFDVLTDVIDRRVET
jgi:hypothetical protein